MSVSLISPRPRKIIDIRHPYHQMSFVETRAFLAREREESLDPLYDDLGYMVNFAVHANLPYRPLPNIKVVNSNGQIVEVPQNEFTRVSNLFRMSLMSPRAVGLPWGIIPRVVVLWWSTQAVETKSPIIRLGRTRSDFMQSLGMPATGGKNGSIARFMEMMKRLVSCNFTVTYDQGKTFKMRQTALVSAADFVYDDKHPWQCDLRLTDDFYSNAVFRPIPVRWSVINLLRGEAGKRGSPLALDLYVWATYRVYHLEKPLEVSFKQLRQQLGSNYTNSRQGKLNFETDVTERLNKVCQAYPELKVVVRPGKGITLFPSPTSVPKGGQNFRYLDR